MWWIRFSFLLLVVFPAWAQDLPSNMTVQGTLTGNDDVAIAAGQKVLVVRANSFSTVEGTGTVQANGAYQVQLDKTRATNGVLMTMLLQDDSAKYQLNFGLVPVSFEFLGSFPAVTTLVLNLNVGKEITPEEEEDAVIYDPVDLNKDGVIDETDLRLMRSALGKNTTDIQADLNQDGKVTVKDAGVVIKEIHKQTFDQRRQNVESSRPEVPTP